ncbi:MAG: hypothetical protein Kow0099_08200 [Candidatus Abyssubacteria bacterium]
MFPIEPGNLDGNFKKSPLRNAALGLSTARIYDLKVNLGKRPNLSEFVHI